MVNVCERWATDRTDGLQSAFFNGVGYESWENVWGVWNQLTRAMPRPCAASPRSNGRWPNCWSAPTGNRMFPHCKQGVFASRFPAKDKNLWLVVNRSNKNLRRRATGRAVLGGRSVLRSLERRRVETGDRRANSQAGVPDRGPGLRRGSRGGRKANARRRAQLMMQHGETDSASAEQLSSQWKILPQRIVEIRRPNRIRRRPMEWYTFRPASIASRFRASRSKETTPTALTCNIRGKLSRDVPTTKNSTSRRFSSTSIPSPTPSSRRFLDASGYRPKDDHNFLKDWINGTYPEGWAKKPVTWVSIEDARAYAAWAGKRLPHEWEWQYAAQGKDGRPYPWGTEKNPDATPKHESGRELRPPTDVDAFPRAPVRLE